MHVPRGVLTAAAPAWRLRSDRIQVCFAGKVARVADGLDVGCERKRDVTEDPEVSGLSRWQEGLSLC